MTDLMNFRICAFSSQFLPKPKDTGNARKTSDHAISAISQHTPASKLSSLGCFLYLPLRDAGSRISQVHSLSECRVNSILHSVCSSFTQSPPLSPLPAFPHPREKTGYGPDRWDRKSRHVPGHSECRHLKQHQLWSEARVCSNLFPTS